MIAGIIIVLVIFWLFFLYVTRRAKLNAWHFLIGSIGLFLILMIIGLKYFVTPLACGVSGIAGLFGKIGNVFSSYLKYAIIFVESRKGGSITLLVDMECSGLIEILAFISLLAFFEVYTWAEKIIVGIAGFCYLMLANALRISIIAWIVYFAGVSAYGVAHAFIGRIFFYILSIILYFYVFTKPQVIRTHVGNFAYRNKDQ